MGILAGLVGAGSGVAVVGCLLWAAPAVAQPLPAVTVAPAEMRVVGGTAVFTGRAVAVQKVEIQPRVSGFVEAMDFAEGGPVAKDQVLFRIEDGRYRAAVAEIEGSLIAARSAERLAELERDRQAQLVQRQTVAQAVLDAAEAELGKARGEVMRLEAALETARLDLSYTEVRAPFDGIAGLAGADVGALVGPGSGPLVTVVRTDPMTVEFPVPQAAILRFERQVEAGKATLTSAIGLKLADGSDYAETGDIDFTGIDVARGTDTITIRAVFPNPEGKLKDGALVRVALRTEAAEPMLTVPRQAVQRDMQGDFVLVVGPDSRVELRRVTATAAADGLSVVTAGLAEGETVVVEGLTKARPGAVVDAAPAAGG